MRIFVMGDIHGAHKALVQCLERSNFDKKTDVLIQLGDVVDGWSESYECVEELLSITNLISIKGNHDDFFLSYINNGVHGSQWTQGAKATLQSYQKRDMVIPDSHKKFFRSQLKYFISDKNNLYVHAGFNRHQPINKQSYDYIYWWDRDLWLAATSYEKGDKQLESRYQFKIVDKFNEIYIGHTCLTNWNYDVPQKAANIWNMDTGAGWDGKLSIMNIETKELYQSNIVSELYSNEKGRN